MYDSIEETISNLSPAERAELFALLDTVLLPSISLRDFVKGAWAIVEPGVPYRHNWHIDAISEHLEAVTFGQILNLIINIPPRHMKSTLVSVCWHPWVWTFNPFSKWLFFSHSKALSTRDTVKARRIIQSQWYQQNWGDSFEMSGDQNLKTYFSNTKGGARIASSVGGSTGEGANFLVADDILQINDRHSEAKREGSNDFWGTTVSTRRNDEHAAAVIISQRLHEHDVVGYVQEKEAEGAPHYEMLVIPAEFEGSKYTTSIGWSDPRTQEGELLFPDLFPPHVIATLKRSLGSEQTAAQLQQRPSPAGGEIVKTQWWRFWQSPGLTLPPVRIRLEDGKEIECEVVTLPHVNNLKLAQSWDMAFKETTTSSYVVGQEWGYDGMNSYLLDQIRDRMDMPQTLTAVERLNKAWPKTEKAWVEAKANGPAVVAMLKAKIPQLTESMPDGGKRARLYAAAPFIENGNIYLPHPQIAPWVNEFIKEVSQFPNGAHNDQVDSLSQYVIERYVNPSNKRRAGVWGKKR